jgi:hypothetical protein
VFIELTDHLRCPADHEEAFLVLVPERMEGRRVVAGHLGCPVCGWGTGWTEGIPDFHGRPAASGEAISAPSDASPATGGGPAFDAAAALALLGLDGPGGWVAFAGRTGALARQFAELLPNVNIVAVNPPAAAPPDDTVSVIRSGVWPLKRHSLRGVVVGADAAAMAAAALGSVLPGLRAAGEGEPPPLGASAELVAVAPGAWVVRQG